VEVGRFSTGFAVRSAIRGESWQVGLSGLARLAQRNVPITTAHLTELHQQDLNDGNQESRFQE
jgi:hypothetical protein